MTAILKVDEIQDTSGNLIIKEDSNTITVGASGDTITIPSGATISNSGTATGFGGITMVDQWRLTADYTWSSPGNLTSNLEQVDGTNQGTLGTGMSESSGVFTFPSTGIYIVRFSAQQYKNGDRRDIQINITTTSNNSSYANIAECITHITQSASSTTYIQGMTETILDITDTSNQKVKFAVFTDATTAGSSTKNKTFMTFIRLGDT